MSRRGDSASPSPAHRGPAVAAASPRSPAAPTRSALRGSRVAPALARRVGDAARMQAPRRLRGSVASRRRGADVPGPACQRSRHGITGRVPRPCRPGSAPYQRDNHTGVRSVRPGSDPARSRRPRPEHGGGVRSEGGGVAGAASRPRGCRAPDGTRPEAPRPALGSVPPVQGHETGAPGGCPPADFLFTAPVRL